ncbi:glutaredoxin domain-containing protein [uncultured Kocuria sp.]|uniref:glutaredoxin domain-containing protein n=1 Tax=uncultured Kocuria sp. TaxID=259305 RepID=UPI00261F09CA|nr:glutaredoxin domain-containing protein [uncultured Kocuria sp.]
MSGRSVRSWWLAALVLLVTGAAVVVRLGRGELGEAGIAVLAGAAGVAVCSPLVFPRRGADPDAVTVYYRPGCGYCLRLRASLGSRARRARWVDIWADPDAAAYVRSVNGGDATVPTVVLDGVPHTNPSPATVRAALERRA